MKDPSPEQIASLIADLGRPSNDVQLAAEDALVRIGQPAVEALIKATGSLIERVRWRSAYVLGRIGDLRALPVLVEMASESDSPEGKPSYEAILALGELQCIEAVEFLTRLLRAQVPGTATFQWASAALGRSGIPAVRPLQGLLKEGSADIRAAACYALEVIEHFEVYRDLEHVPVPLCKHVSDQQGSRSSFINWCRRGHFYRWRRRKSGSYYPGARLRTRALRSKARALAGEITGG